MKLDDVLAAAGDHQLSGFDWGVSAVILVNSVVPADNQIDISHTGKEAHAKLRSAPSATLLAILMREVQLNGSSVEFLPMASGHNPGIPPTVPPMGSRRMSPLAVGVLMVLTIIGLMFTWSSIQTTRATGQVVEHETIKTIISAMVELVKEPTKPESQH